MISLLRQEHPCDLLSSGNLDLADDLAASTETPMRSSFDCASATWRPEYATFCILVFGLQLFLCKSHTTALFESGIDLTGAMVRVDAVVLGLFFFPVGRYTERLLVFWAI